MTKTYEFSTITFIDGKHLNFISTNVSSPSEAIKNFFWDIEHQYDIVDYGSKIYMYPKYQYYYCLEPIRFIYKEVKE